MIDIEWPEIAEILFAAKGIKSGFWRLAVKLRQAGIIAEFQEVGTGKTEQFPTSIVGIQAIAMMPAQGPGPMVFEASAGTSSRKPGKKLAAVPPTGKAKVPDGSVKRAVPKPSVKLPRPRA